jgi:hypothetical protein
MTQRLASFIRDNMEPILQATDIPVRYVLLATRMLRSAERMGKPIYDLIDFTRTHLGHGIPISLRPGNVVTVRAQVVSELRTHHPERLIQLKRRLWWTPVSMPTALHRNDTAPAEALLAADSSRECVRS